MFSCAFWELTKNNQKRHQKCSLKQGVLKNFTKFAGKHLCQNLFFYKVVGLRPATLLKRRLWHRCFSVKFAKFLRKPFLQSTSGRLLLLHVICLIEYSLKNFFAKERLLLRFLRYCCSNVGWYCHPPNGLPGVQWLVSILLYRLIIYMRLI